jgi:hypothetical protein
VHSTKPSGTDSGPHQALPLTASRVLCAPAPRRGGSPACGKHSAPLAPAQPQPLLPLAARSYAAGRAAAHGRSIIQAEAKGLYYAALGASQRVRVGARAERLPPRRWYQGKVPGAALGHTVK